MLREYLRLWNLERAANDRVAAAEAALLQARHECTDLRYRLHIVWKEMRP